MAQQQFHGPLGGVLPISYRDSVKRSGISNGVESVKRNENGHSASMQIKGPSPVVSLQIDGLLNMESSQVIENIFCNLKNWQTLLQEDSIAYFVTKGKNSSKFEDDDLMNIIKLLGDTICNNDSTVPAHELRKVDIIKVSLLSENLATKINLKCDQMQGDFLRSIDTEFPYEFFFNLARFCGFALAKLKHPALDFLNKVLPSILSVLGYVNSEKVPAPFTLETFEKFADIKKLKEEIEDDLKQSKEKLRQRYGADFDNEDAPNTEPPDDFRCIPVVPTLGELLSENDTFLRSNLVFGPYQNADHYQDVQFRLFREDFVRPLKLAVQEYRKCIAIDSKKKPKLDNVRVSQNVKLLGIETTRNGKQLVQKVQLDKNDYRGVKWDQSKRLINGALVVFSSDNFKNAFFATVSERNDAEMRSGIFGVQWELESITKRLPKQGRTFTMLEPEIFFEAYRYTLETLKHVRLSNFPLSEFILYASTNVGPPKYLSTATSLMNLGGKCIRPLSTSNWPTAAELKMDEKQYQAFQTCLTKEFAIVQGPPGTGKTYLGLKVVATLLENISLWNSGNEKCPILIVCYTNHALDQFLEGILTLFEERLMEPKMIRIGSMSKSERIKPFSLREVKERNKNNRSKKGHCHDYAYQQIRSEAFDACDYALKVYERFDNEFKELDHLQALIDLSAIGCNKALREKIPLHVLQLFHDPEWFGYDYSWFSENPNSLASVREIFGTNSTKGTGQKLPPAVRASSHQSEKSDGPKDQCSHPLFATKVEYLHDNILDVQNKLKNHRDFEPDDVDYIKKLEKDAAKLKAEKLAWDSFILFTKEVLHQYDQEFISVIPKALERLKLHDQSTDDFPLKAKWSVYFHVLDIARGLAQESKKQALIKQQKAQDDLRRVRKEGDAKLLRESLIVGMTTTGAAKHNEMLRTMQPKIVIVEEAAEVLEAHIVTCLTEWCEQLILIGDHQQLRPSVNVYELCTKHSLDVSLFERMVLNELPCNTISEQHRMRPCIAELISGGTIYEELSNAPRVYQYPKVMGTVKDLFFFNHEKLESSVAELDSKSKSNQFEAEFVVELCLHFLAQGYKPEQVTILTTYRGQEFLIKRIMKREGAQGSGVRLTCVDNYQGEESEIIILSLVRSSKNGSIGFVSTDNRICVALSRAKHGMFVFGNMRLLAQKSSTWRQIREKLEKKDNIGTTLELECQVHGTISKVSKPTDFPRMAPNGGCLSKCGTELPCGHVCAMQCHIQDKNHEEYKCKERCSKICERKQHQCLHPCFKKCPPCGIKIQKHLPCGHDLMVKCFEYDGETLCRTYLNKLLPCGHSEEIHCCKDPEKHSCKHDVKIPLSCGHDFPTMCFKRDHPGLCLELVKRRLPCQHEADVECSKDLMDVKCQWPVTKIFACGHETAFPCSIDTSFEVCHAEVQKKLACNHPRKMECSADASKFECIESVDVILSACSHTVTVLCKKVNDAKCAYLCNSELPCKHRCSRSCHKGDDDDHKNQFCREPCSRNCSKGHPCAAPAPGGKPHYCGDPCPPCKVSTKKKLPCGHKRKVLCFAVELPICDGKCKKTLDCNHMCKNMCIEPCGPCTELVEKEGECGHTILVECGQPASQDKCTVLVESPMVSPCGHKVRIHCNQVGKVSGDYLLTVCEAPCNYSFKEDIDFGCPHKCKGTCSTCSQGRFHVKCKASCGKLLFCGHKCTSSCSKPCPPCKKNCVFRCEHAQCQGQCGHNCYGCAEPCGWKCMHEACTKFCSALCDRAPCDRSCRKKLRCGHLCIGFCGEPCPTLCRICNAKELQELANCSAQELCEMRFVLLEDCGHTIYFPTLDKYMRGSGDRVEAKFCPRPDCKVLITKSRRYGNIIKTWMSNAKKVKQEKVELDVQVQKEVPSILKRLSAIRCPRELSFVRNFCKNKLSFKYNKKGLKPTRNAKQVDPYTVMGVDVITNYLEETNEFLRQVASPQNQERQAQILSAVVAVFDNMITRKFPFSVAECKDLEKEFRRIYSIIKLPKRKKPSVRVLGAHSLSGTQWFVCVKGHVYFASVFDDTSSPISCTKCLASTADPGISATSVVQNYCEADQPRALQLSALDASFANLDIS